MAKKKKRKSNGTGLVFAALACLLVIMLVITWAEKKANTKQPSMSVPDQTQTDPEPTTEPEPEPEPTPAATTNPVPDVIQNPTPTPDVIQNPTPETNTTKEPEKTTEPEPAPEPEPEPEEEDEPDELPATTIVNSGTIKSDTGTKMNLVVYWTLYETGGEKSVELEIGLKTYSIDVGARKNGLVIKVNGKSYKFSTDAIEYDGSSQTVISFGTYTFDLDGDTADLEVSWAFKGSYSGVDMPTITAEGSAR